MFVKKQQDAIYRRNEYNSPVSYSDCDIVIAGGDGASYGGMPTDAPDWRTKLLREVTIDPARVISSSRYGTKPESLYRYPQTPPIVSATPPAAVQIHAVNYRDWPFPVSRVKRTNLGYQAKLLTVE